MSLVAKGQGRADGSGLVPVVARATAAGRRLLRTTTRARDAVVEAALDGAPGARHVLTLRAR